MAEFIVKFSKPMLVVVEASNEAEARRIFDNPQTDDERAELDWFEDDEEAQADPYVITSVERIEDD